MTGAKASPAGIVAVELGCGVVAAGTGQVLVGMGAETVGFNKIEGDERNTAGSSENRFCTLE